MAKRVSGGSRLRRQLRQWPDTVTDDLRAEIRFIGTTLKAEIAFAAPKDKGDLGRAAHSVVSSDGLSVRVGYSRDAAGFKRIWKKAKGFVAQFQERGTVHHAAQPFIRPVWRARVGWALNRIDAAVSRAIRKAGNL